MLRFHLEECFQVKRKKITVNVHFAELKSNPIIYPGCLCSSWTLIWKQFNFNSVVLVIFYQKRDEKPDI